jgi:hypothetical protein
MDVSMEWGRLKPPTGTTATRVERIIAAPERSIHHAA